MSRVIERLSKFVTSAIKLARRLASCGRSGYGVARCSTHNNRSSSVSVRDASIAPILIFRADRHWRHSIAVPRRATEPGTIAAAGKNGVKQHDVDLCIAPSARSARDSGFPNTKHRGPRYWSPPPAEPQRGIKTPLFK